MVNKILVTGSSGLVGSNLRKRLLAQGFNVAGFDIRAPGIEAGDIRDAKKIHDAISGCQGIIHLAAISRVVWAQNDPDTCWSTNVEGLRNVIASIQQQEKAPWLIFASSREVYGQSATLPVSEDAPLSPVNVYGRSKIEGELLIEQASNEGIRASIIRLSNVYGRTNDHKDRVVPAFARAAVLGTPLRVDGPDHTFDFTHVDDATSGILALVNYLVRDNAAPPPIHFLTGSPTTLLQLARQIINYAGSASTIVIAPERTFDVSKFYGNPERAGNILGWSPTVTLQAGLEQLINDFRHELMSVTQQNISCTKYSKVEGAINNCWGS